MSLPPPERRGTDVAGDEISVIIGRALAEDIGPGDITTEFTTTGAGTGEGRVTSKEPGIIAGLTVAEGVFRAVDPMTAVECSLTDGGSVSPGDVVLTVTGRAASILKAERTALNFLQRMSGIATLTGKFVREVEGTRARITDTRKTAPGLRLTDKMAVVAGGGVNHRFGLYDMVLIKDNHIAAAGGIAAAVSGCVRGLGDRSPAGDAPVIEVETRNLREVEEAVACEGVSRIMLDNFQVGDMLRAVDLIAGRVEVEASGNVSLATVRRIAETGVDFISVGALTHSAAALDLALVYSGGKSTLLPR